MTLDAATVKMSHTFSPTCYSILLLNDLKINRNRIMKTIKKIVLISFH